LLPCFHGADYRQSQTPDPKIDTQHASSWDASFDRDRLHNRILSASAVTLSPTSSLSYQVAGHQIALQPFPHAVVTPGNHLVIHRLLVVNLNEIIPNEFHRLIYIDTGCFRILKRPLNDLFLNCRLFSS
jgi:hypothetical protein